MNRRAFLLGGVAATAAGAGARRGLAESGGSGSAAAFASPKPLIAGASVPLSTSGTPRFGVNFVPRKRWLYSWLDWDQQAIADDLSGVAELGLDHIRAQCVWPLFQPGINTVSGRALSNLNSLLDAADKVGLDVEVTVLNGWMSGLEFIPAWVAPLAYPFGHRKPGNMFTNPDTIEGEKLLFRRIAEAVGGHPRFLGFDIGNELDVLIQIPNCNPASIGDADAWAREMLRYVEQIAPNKLHVNGVSHAPWYNDFGFSREEIATTGQASVVHSYLSRTIRGCLSARIPHCCIFRNTRLNLLTPIKPASAAAYGWKRLTSRQNSWNQCFATY